jgi:hypothetical protein
MKPSQPDKLIDKNHLTPCIEFHKQFIELSEILKEESNATIQTTTREPEIETVKSWIQ